MGPEVTAFLQVAIIVVVLITSRSPDVFIFDYWCRSCARIVNEQR